MIVHQLSRADARRVAVRAQRLDRDRPTDLLELVRHLTVLQLDQTAAVAPSADLVAWSRLGSTYRPDDLRTALESGSLIELRGLARPRDDLPLFYAAMAQWPGTGDLRDWQEDNRDWVAANDSCRLDILDRLRSDGPLTTADLPDTCVVPWRSSGWTNNQNVIKLLDFMVVRGEVAPAGYEGRDRLWDLASRIYPDEPAVPAEEAVRIRDERRLHALGIARARGAEHPLEPNGVGDAGQAAVIEGVKGTWRVDPAYLGGTFAGRAVLLSPLDRLVYDRKRMVDVFDFDYQLEMYKPVANRRWGFWAMPILYGDRLVGKLDAAADRKAGVFEVNAVHRDVAFTKTMTAAVDGEIRALARWLELDLALPDDEPDDEPG
jgi:uncharacterized protein YcaQ